MLDGAYMQTGDKSEQIKGLYVTQITGDGDLAVLSGSNQFSVSDKVIRGGVKIQKRDLETGDTKPQGSATLKDTAFDIISLNDNSVLVEGKLYKKNEVVKTIRTDIEGIASTSADLLPYGKFRIVESEAPNGYLTDGAKPIDFAITENGKIVDLTDEAHSIYNQIKRGDIEGVKIGAGTHKRLADVPFRITSKTTGESHVVVTDDNGQFSTSADWASHKHNTNAGKTSEDGVWFGTSEPDDSKGALPYDTYIIEELRSDSNKGFELIPPFEIVVSRNNLVIDLGTLTDEYEKEISIHTTATSKDGEKTILAGKEVTIVDTVKLDGLTKGTKYQLKGWQMLKEENAELIIDGKRVENDYTFVADEEEMKVEISYTFNASALGGKNLVTFEELYDLSNPDEPVKVAEHKDIEDDGQTVLITERIIKIHTTATDKDGNKELEAGKEVTIIDTVTLEGLEVGTQYKLVGWQMLKEENAELLINGKRVESDYTFTADSETMKVEVAFTFDATSLDGKQLVTFEELYDLSNPDEPKKVNMEFQGNAIKKMYMLPFKTSSIFKNKFYILFVLLTFCIVLQNGALCIIGNIFLPNGTFELLTLVKYTGYCFVSSLPVLAFMLLVSSRCENIWFTLGIGVAGFFSGMAMSLSDISLFLVNPFVLMMKPAVASTASIDTGILILGVFETIIFFMIGWYLCKIKHYE